MNRRCAASLAPALFAPILLGVGAWAIAQDSPPAEDPWLEIDVVRQARAAEFRLFGRVEVPNGTEAHVTLEFDGQPAHAARGHARVERGGFTARFPAGPATVLPGVYRARVRIQADPERVGTAAVRVGTAEEECAARREADEWFARCCRELLALARSLDHARGPDAQDAATEPWEERFLALRAQVWSVTTPGKYFALYRSAEIRELLTELTLLELLERQRLDDPSSSSNDAALRRIHLRQSVQRVGRLAGEPPEAPVPAREALARWLAGARVLLEDLGNAPAAGEPEVLAPDDAVERLTALSNADLAAAGRLPAFRALDFAHPAAIEALATILEHAPATPGRAAAVASARKALAEVDAMLMADRAGVRPGLVRMLEELEKAAIARASGRTDADGTRAAACIRDLEADDAARFHYPEFLSRARTALGCLAELADLARPEHRVDPDKREERRAWFERTLVACRKRLAELAEQDR